MVSENLVLWAWRREPPALAKQVYSAGACEHEVESWLLSVDGKARAGAPLKALELSVFLRVDRIDAALDPLLESRMRAAPIPSIAAAYRILLRRVGVSVARVAYARMCRALNADLAHALRTRGAPAPRLWLAGEGGGSPAEELPEARLVLDKLANYQIDLDAVARDLEAGS